MDDSDEHRSAGVQAPVTEGQEEERCAREKAAEREKVALAINVREQSALAEVRKRGEKKAKEDDPSRLPLVERDTPSPFGDAKQPPAGMEVEGDAPDDAGSSSSGPGCASRLDGSGISKMPMELLEQIQGDWLDDSGAGVTVSGDDVAVTRDEE